MKKLLLVIVILLLAGWAVWQSGRSDEGLQSMPGWTPPSLSKATDIAIEGSGIAVHLHRDGASAGKGWMVDVAGQPAAANADAVNQLIGDLQSMRPVRVVAHSAAHDADLHLDAGHAIDLRVKDASSTMLLDLRVGGQGTDLVSTYVRRAGHPEVLAVNRALLWQLKRAPSGWKAVKNKAPAAAPAKST